MKTYVKLTGFEDLEAIFRYMSQADQKKIQISAFKRAVKPTVDAAKSNVPLGKTRNLYKSIGTSTIRNEVGIYVGARIKGGNKGYIGHIVEEGTVERFYITKNGKRHNTGRMRYTGFFKRAADSTETEVINSVATQWHNAMLRYVVRHK